MQLFQDIDDIVVVAVVVLARLESPTRSLLMEAPKGIQILAEAGDIQAICRNELRLESKDGEVSRPANHSHWFFMTAPNC